VRLPYDTMIDVICTNNPTITNYSCRNGARIVGQLDLEAVMIACSLLFGGCLFDGLIVLRDAEALAIRLRAVAFPE
jgi:hypothetical protein